MPAQTRKPAASSAQATSTTAPANAQEPLSDSLKDELKDGGTVAGLENYQSLLGKWLGTELYTALAGELTLEKLQGHATKAWESAIKSGVKALDGVDGNNAEAGAFTKALQEAYGQAASDMLATETGQKVIGKLNGFVDANPGVILLVALLAAGGAVAANVSLPEFKQKFGLGGGFSASVSADLGKIREIALKDLSAALEYNSGPLIAAAKISRGENGEVTGDISAKLGGDDAYIKGNAKINQDGVDVWGLSGLVQRPDGTKLTGDVSQASGKDPVIKGSLTTVDGNVTEVRSIEYDHGTGAVKFKDAQTAALGGGNQITSEVGGASDGSSYGAVGFKSQLNSNTTANGEFRQTQGADGLVTNSLKGGVDYKGNDFNASLSGTVNDQTGGSVTGKLNGKLGENTTGGLNLTQNFGDKTSTSGNTFLDYKTDDLRLRGQYDFDTDKDKHSFTGLAQKNFDNDLKLRMLGTVGTDANGFNADVGAMGYKKINDDVALFGGGSVRHDQMDGTRFVPKAGVEVKGVPIEYSYDPATKQHKVGVTLFKW